MAMLVQTSEAPVKAKKPAKKPRKKPRNTAVPAAGIRETPGALSVDERFELGVDEWFELNSRDDGGRYELIDGSLIVSPAPSAQHQWIGDRLRRFLEDAAPEELMVVTGTGLLLDSRPGVIPDVMVVERKPIRDGAQVVDPEWAHLVVEIVYRSTTAMDRIVKPVKYAEAGIPHFWRVETRPFRGQGSDELPVIFTYALDENDDYQLIHRVATGTTVNLTEPFAFRVDPEALSRI